MRGENAFSDAKLSKEQLVKVNGIALLFQIDQTIAQLPTNSNGKQQPAMYANNKMIVPAQKPDNHFSVMRDPFNA